MTDRIMRVRWIECDDRMPPDHEWVLVAWDCPVGRCISPSTHVEVVYLEDEQWMLAANTPAEMLYEYEPTHWMQLPPPPTSEMPDFICCRNKKG